MRLLTASVLGVLLGSAPAFANSNASGDTGRSSKTAGQTCNSNCHSPTGSQPMVALTGPATLAAGATGDFTLTLTANASPNNHSGCDIATSSGQATLAPAIANLTLSNGELVQQTPLPFSNGTAAYTFKVTAPSTPGSFTVYAYGMATDGSGTGGDNGKAATPLVVNVTGGAPGDMAGAPADAGVTPVDDMAMASSGGGGGGGGSGGSGGTPTPTGGAPDMAYVSPGGLPGCDMAGAHAGAGSGLALALAVLALALLRRRHSAS